ncbi:MAG: phage tail tape measure protein [Candidatus Anammoxibacter sp.]
MAKGASIVIRISGNSKSFRKELDRLERESKKTIGKLGRDGKKLTAKTQEESKKRIAIAKRESDARVRLAKRVGLVLAALAVAGIGASIIEFAKFEQGLAGVSKTTNIVGRDLKNLGEDITKLSIALGTSTGKLLITAKAAGQLGVKGSANILKFTKVLTGLEKTTNITGEEGAIALARLIGVSGELIDNVDRIGSAIVGLGNNTKALENQILFTATEIAGAGKVFGITATQALGLGAAFAELAIPAELARSTVVRTFGEIQKAISEGGTALEKLIVITGLTGDQLKETFEKDATKVFSLFLKGVGKLPKSGISKFLKDFNLGGIRLAATLPKLALAADKVNTKLEESEDFYQKNTAATKELAIQLDTTIGRFNSLKTELAKTKKEIGEEFIPVTEATIKLLKVLSPFIRDTLVPAIASMTDTFTTFVEFSDQKLTPAFDGIFSSMQKVAEAYRDAKIAAKNFFDIQFNAREMVRDQVTKGIDPDLRPPLLEPEQTTIFGEVIDPESAEKLKAFNDELAEIMAEARNEELVARFLAAEEITEAEEEVRLAKIETDEIEKERLAKERGLKKLADLKAIQDKEKADKKAKKLAKKEAEQAAKDLISIKDARVKAEERLDQAIVDSAFASLNQIVGDNKAAQIALLLAQKAFAIARIIINTSEAATLAFASQLIPGDPTSLARAAAAAAATEALGAARVALVAVTAIPEVIGALRAQEGGIVPGGFGGGDRVPFLLEPGELIVPQNLNPLSPNFDEALGGFGGAQSVNVQIDLTDRASEFVTVNQREDAKLGIQR